MFRLRQFLVWWGLFVAVGCAYPAEVLRIERPVKVGNAVRIVANRVNLGRDPWVAHTKRLAVEIVAENLSPTAVTLDSGNVTLILSAPGRKAVTLLPINQGEGEAPGSLSRDLEEVRPVRLAPGVTQRLWYAFGNIEPEDFPLPVDVQLHVPTSEGQTAATVNVVQLPVADFRAGSPSWVGKPPAYLQKIGYGVSADWFGTRLNLMRLNQAWAAGPLWINYGVSVGVRTSPRQSERGFVCCVLGVDLGATAPLVRWPATFLDLKFGVDTQVWAGGLTRSTPIWPYNEEPLPAPKGMIGPFLGIELGSVAVKRSDAAPFLVRRESASAGRFVIGLGATWWFGDQLPRSGSPGGILYFDYVVYP